MGGFVLVLLVALAPAEAEQPVRQLLVEAAAAWNRHDLAAFADRFTPDGEVIPPSGAWWRGRGEIAAQLQALHKGPLKNSRVRFDVIAIRFLTPEVALVHANGEDDLGQVGPDGKRLPPGRGHVTFVVERRDRAWQIRLEQVTATEGDARR
jgi:uncharacterized protein (TIGR02246 family)